MLIDFNIKTALFFFFICLFIYLFIIMSFKLYLICSYVYFKLSTTVVSDQIFSKVSRAFGVEVEAVRRWGFSVLKSVNISHL